MKHIILGDTHGTTYWKEIIDLENDYDEVTFLGDYLDSFTISVEDQIKNLNEILEFKRSNPEKVTLLTGNHDYHYSNRCPAHEYYSGYKQKTRAESHFILNNAMDNHEMVICKLINNKYLLSHAGFTNTWLKSFNIISLGESFISEINNLFHNVESSKSFGFNGFDGYGNNPTQGPLWVRPMSLMYDKAFPNYTQIVGHTPVKHIDLSGPIILSDCISEREREEVQYLVIEDDVVIIKSL